MSKSVVQIHSPALLKALYSPTLLRSLLGRNQISEAPAIVASLLAGQAGVPAIVALLLAGQAEGKSDKLRVTSDEKRSQKPELRNQRKMSRPEKG